MKPLASFAIGCSTKLTLEGLSVEEIISEVWIAGKGGVIHLESVVQTNHLGVVLVILYALVVAVWIGAR